MDIRSFIASIVESLAWPVASLALVLIFKGEILAAIPFLKRLKAGPLEAEFDRDLKQLKASSAAQTHAGKERSVDVASHNFLFQLAELHPRSAILEAWVRLEAAARAALPSDSSKTSTTGYIPAARLAEALVRAGVIDQGQVTLYHELRRLRNEVAHLVGLEPTQESVRSYIDLASSLQGFLERHTE
jgi:hypothetical protein